MMKITYEEFKRINNNLKLRFTTAGQSERIVKIDKTDMKKNLVRIQGHANSNVQTIPNLVSLVCKNMVAISNPSILQNWQGFIKESSLNLEQKQKMQNTLLMTILNNLCDSPETFLAIAALKLNLDKEDIKKFKQGILPKYNETVYRNAVKYILSCKCEEVNNVLIRQGIVLSS